MLKLPASLIQTTGLAKLKLIDDETGNGVIVGAFITAPLGFIIDMAIMGGVCCWEGPFVCIPVRWNHYWRAERRRELGKRG